MGKPQIHVYPGYRRDGGPVVIIEVETSKNDGTIGLSEDAARTLATHLVKLADEIKRQKN